MVTELLDKREARIRRMFGNIAPSYDLLNHLLSLNIDRYWRWQTTRIVPPVTDAGPILDVCTGTGDLALAFDRAAGYRYELSVLQAEVSLTQVFDRPLTGRIFFEEVIRENLDLGRPDQVGLIFDRRVIRTTPHHRSTIRRTETLSRMRNADPPMRARG